MNPGPTLGPNLLSMRRATSFSRIAPLLLGLLPPGIPCAHGQSLPNASPAPAKEVVELSPFQVSSDKELGYMANHTLAGSRLRTNLAEVANAISVFTPELIADLNAFSENDLMRYSAAAVPERTDQTAQVQGINTETGVFQYRIRGQLASR